MGGVGGSIKILIITRFQNKCLMTWYLIKSTFQYNLMRRSKETSNLYIDQKFKIFYPKTNKIEENEIYQTIKWNNLIVSKNGIHS